MAGYINREKLVDYVKDAYGGGNEDNTCIRYRDIIDVIQSVPYTDVVPVKQGTWIEVEGDKLVGIDSNSKDMYRYYRYNICAKCGKRNAIKSNFCPNCGAKMDLE